MILIDIDTPQSKLNNNFFTKGFVFDSKYLSQNSINFNMLGVFWNYQDEQISKLFLDLYLEQHLMEMLRFITAAGAVCHHCIWYSCVHVHKYWLFYRVSQKIWFKPIFEFLTLEGVF